MYITTATPRQLAMTYADCTKCSNRKVKDDGSSMCTVKLIDCSVRKGKRPCSHFDQEKKGKELNKYMVHLTACATQIVTAEDAHEAGEKADWCDAEISDWEVAEVEKV